MLLLCVMGMTFLLNRLGSFWLWRARLTGNFLADRLSYLVFLLIGTLLSLTMDLDIFREHIQFSSVYSEALLITIPAILIGEFLYLRKMTFIIQTLAILRARSTKDVEASSK